MPPAPAAPVACGVVSFSSRPYGDAANFLIQNYNHLLDANHIPRVLAALSELRTLSQLYTPPHGFTEFQDRSGLPVVLCVSSRLVLSASKTWIAKNWEYVVCLLQTTALFLHEAYAATDGSLPSEVALSLAKQVVGSKVISSLSIALCGATASLSGFIAAELAALDKRLEMKTAATNTEAPPAAAEPHNSTSKLEKLQYGFAVLQLFTALSKMWPSGLLKSKDVAPMAGMAARLAATLLQASRQQPCLDAGVRVELILQESLALAERLVQQLAAFGGQFGNTSCYFKELATSPPLRLLLLLLEAQIGQLAGSEHSATAAAAATATARTVQGSDNRTNAPACTQDGTCSSSSSTSIDTVLQPQVAQHPLPEAETAGEEYFAALLGSFCPEKQQAQQFGDKLRAVSGRSGNAVRACTMTLTVLKAMLEFWAELVDQGQTASEQSGKQYLEEQEALPLRLIRLPSLSCKLLQLAISSMQQGSSVGGRQSHSSSSSSVMLELSAAAAAAAAQVAKFWSQVICPAWAKWVPVEGILQLCTQLLHTTAVAAAEMALPAADNTASSSAAGSKASRAIVSAACSAFDLLNSMQEVQTANTVKDWRQMWQQRAMPLAVALERCGRAVAACGHAAGTAFAQDFMRCVSSLVCDGELQPLSVSLAATGRGKDELLSLLTTTHKLSSSHSGCSVWGLEQQNHYLGVVSKCASIMCREALAPGSMHSTLAAAATAKDGGTAGAATGTTGAGSSSSSTGSSSAGAGSSSSGSCSADRGALGAGGDSSSSDDSPVPFAAAPWMMLWAQCIVEQTELHSTVLSQLSKAAAPDQRKWLPIKPCADLMQALCDLELITEHLTINLKAITAMLQDCFDISAKQRSMCHAESRCAAACCNYNTEVDNSGIEAPMSSSSSSIGGQQSGCDRARGTAMRRRLGRWSSTPVLLSPSVTLGVTSCYWQRVPSYTQEFNLLTEQLQEEFVQVLTVRYQVLAATDGKVSRRPARAGSDPYNALPAVGKALQLIEELSNTDTVDQAVALVQHVPTTLPAPQRCNNLACRNLAGGSELQLVGAKGCICAGCKVARYCSRSCQAATWPVHKSVCRRLKAAVAAAGARQQ